MPIQLGTSQDCHNIITHVFTWTSDLMLYTENLLSIVPSCEYESVLHIALFALQSGPIVTEGKEAEIDAFPTRKGPSNASAKK